MFCIFFILLFYTFNSQVIRTACSPSRQGNYNYITSQAIDLFLYLCECMLHVQFYFRHFNVNYNVVEHKWYFMSCKIYVFVKNVCARVNRMDIYDGF